MDADDLAARARNGDQEALATLVRGTAPRLYRLFRARGTEHEAAEDLVQDTLVRACRNLHRYDPSRHFVTWLLTIGSRLAVSRFRKQQTRRRLQEQIAELTPRTTPPKDRMAADLWETSRRLLPESQHEVLWLRYGEELSVREIAGVTGRTVSAVKVLLHRGRRRLAQHLRCSPYRPHPPEVT